MQRSNNSPKVAIFDVDGVLTTGQFFYSQEGKAFKVFGADDNDALSLLKPFVEIQFISGDKRGFPISERRIKNDMNYPLTLVSTTHRIDWIKKNFDPSEVVYMGDGIFDHYVMKEVLYGIAPNNADSNAKQHANYVTTRNGGERAVSEACLHILEKFFIPYNPSKFLKEQLGQEWTV